MNGKMPSSGAPMRSNVPGCAVEHVAQEHLEQARHDEQQRDGARVAAQLQQDALPRSRA